jgi:hypothetical protein
MLIPNAAYYANAMMEKTMDFSDLRHATKVQYSIHYTHHTILMDFSDLRHATKEEADAALDVLPSASMFELEVMVRVR